MKYKRTYSEATQSHAKKVGGDTEIIIQTNTSFDSACPESEDKTSCQEDHEADAEGNEFLPRKSLDVFAREGRMFKRHSDLYWKYFEKSVVVVPSFEGEFC